jgi:TRAP-type C4-dicarboxylate transport system permease small subunit
MLHKFNSVVERVYFIAGGLFFLAFIACVLFQIASRNFLPGSFIWTDERGAHYVVEIFPVHFVRSNLALTLLALVLCLPLIYVLATDGLTYAEMSWRRFSFSLGYPMFFQNIVVTVSGAAMAFFAIELVADTWCRLFPKHS